jgi:two-component system, chemotaxis family, protein-glutamate methylesterase/glutaminase
MASLQSPVRVLVVDDSAFMRFAVTRYLEADPEIAVVGSARDGLDALTKIPALRPDVVTLDVEMPRLDGLATLKRIMAECPLPVVMLSSLTQRGARTTVQALMRGAVDFVTKPAVSGDIESVMEELIGKVKMAANGCSVESQRPVIPFEPAVVESTTSPDKPGPRPFHLGDPVLVIGASTGGPRAVHRVLSDLAGDLPAAVVVVQHMPAGFTRSLAQRLNETCAISVQEAVPGDRLARGLVLLAPGDYHLRFEGRHQVVLDQGPRRHHVRPAVDVAMESAAKQHGATVVGAILTGMGCDGTAGCRSIKEAGGRIVAEDESTSVVFGMPRSVIEAGLADHVAPLPNIGALLTNLVTNGRSGL